MLPNLAGDSADIPEGEKQEATPSIIQEPNQFSRRRTNVTVTEMCADFPNCGWSEVIAPVSHSHPTGRF